MVCGAARLDELEFEPLVHRLKFDDAEQRADHVEAAVAVRPQPLHDAVCGLEVSLHASVQRLLDEQRVRLIAHLRVAGRARRAIRRRPHHHAPRGPAQRGGRGVSHPEDVLARDEAEAGVRRLRIVQRLAHVALRCEDERLNARVVVRRTLGVHDLH
tara:strand:- start:662 stop:1132 length:471 start_codon:yes stop_codon:yes gene_type:complete